ncbi:DUF6668 family protein [Phytohabitans suffuscus]|uniref:Uncharacterized protein n=1 Tax=Phytohabitans suffuscus TaxID=624315 RepID=A0A6F8YKP7_9ACTN|nr:DUF6668 family protein [Phytohabitans suffuscus]BCB86528.1 hypothetical protein Psuf_038410 [Phytohabitans suffuscus]
MRAYGDGPARRQDMLSEDGLGWIGAHGGAGATTLTRLLGGTDIGCRWPDAMLAEPARVMMVGRTNLDGLRAVSRALRALHEGRHPAGMRLVAVVLMADAPGRLPVQLTSRIRLLRSVAPVYRVPWIPSFRLGETPKRMPKQLVRLSTMVDSRPEPHRRRS